MRLSCLALALVCQSAWACGPDFPMTLLDQRGAVMAQMPDDVVWFDARRWVAPAQTFAPADADPWADPSETRRQAEIAGLGETEAATLQHMRDSADGNQALTIGAELPAELRDYTAGAVDFHRGDWTNAAARFAAVVALPAEQRQRRGVWAAYMQGRIALLTGEYQSAITAFNLTREFAAQGGSDPLGLAVASFGEQARAARESGDLATALRLYAEQAALGSTSGQASLVVMARQIARTPALHDAALTDELGRRVLVGYLFVRDAEPAEAALLDRLAALPVREIPDADLLAAVLYRRGDDARAAQFAAATTPFAAWVRAKLAIKQGRLDEATAEYAKAIRAFPADPLTSAENARELRCRIAGEAGTLALGRAEFLQALELLYASAEVYWTDFAYVAERVVALEDLRAFVDRVAPDASSAANAEEYAPPPATRLRALLARRMVRSGEAQQAIAYFDDEMHRGAAQSYVAALEETRAWTRTAQARAWYAAAEILRAHGMEIAGFEGDPDYAQYGGSYDLNSPYRYDENFNVIVDERKDLTLEGPFTSDAERERLAQTRAQPLMRFHYRAIAAQHAERAADALPERSQAFAAALCTATSYLLYREPQAAAAIYRRYLNHGAYVPWGAAFGQVCPAPDFDKVEREIRAQWLNLAGRSAIIGGPILIVLLFAIGVWRSRKRA